jgi:hypothetical protein
MARNRAFERPQSTAEREASKLFQSADQKKGMTEHSLAQKAIRDNRERLKAERLAREALVALGKAINQGPGEESRERQAILREWDLWIQTQPLQGNATWRDARNFFLHREARPSPASPDLSTRGHDKWKVVHGWLVDAGRLAGD